jgi:iron complex outermembrane receptor protein
MRWVAELCLFIVAFHAGASEATRKPRDFNIPPDDAVTALRHFASQSGLQVIYSGSGVTGVRTSLVKGKFTPREALDRMLAGTKLSVKEDEKTGAMAITPVASDEHPTRSAESQPDSGTPAPPKKSPRP